MLNCEIYERMTCRIPTTVRDCRARRSSFVRGGGAPRKSFSADQRDQRARYLFIFVRYKLNINVAVRRERHFQPIKRTERFAHLLNDHRVCCASALPAHCQRARLSLESQNFGGPGEESSVGSLAPNWRNMIDGLKRWFCLDRPLLTEFTAVK